MLLSLCSVCLISATWMCLPCRMQHSSCWEPTTSAPFAQLTLKRLFSLQSEPSSRQTSDLLLVSSPTTMNTGESLDTQLRSCSDQLVLSFSGKLFSSTALRIDLLFAVHCLHSPVMVSAGFCLVTAWKGHFFPSPPQCPQGERWAGMRAGKLVQFFVH